MKNTFKQAFQGYKMLFTFKQFKHQEIILKALLLLPATLVFTALFIIASVGYLLERLLSPIFKLTLLFHMRIMRAKTLAGEVKNRLLGLLSVLGTLLFLPFVIAYLLVMLLKGLCKSFMRALIYKLDFASHYPYDSVRIFDDKDPAQRGASNILLKDMQQSESLGKMLEKLLDDASEKEIEPIDSPKEE